MSCGPVRVYPFHALAGAPYLAEGEMALVFGKVTRNVTREEAWDCIAGFAPSNDFGCHDFRDTDAGSMLRSGAKSTRLPGERHCASSSSG